MAKKKKDKEENTSEAEENTKLLVEVQERLKESADAEQDNRKSHIEDTEFENGNQWNEQARLDRENHGRPSFVINKTAGVTKQIIGNIRKMNMSIKVRPVDSIADPKTAEIFDGLIRNIENTSNAQSVYGNAGACAVRGNIGYFRVITDYASDDSFDQDIFIKRIPNPHSVYMDPGAVESDRSDANWCVITTTLAKDKFKADFPDKSWTSNIEPGTGENQADWFSDETVKIAEYFKVGKVDRKLLQLVDGRVVIAEELAETKELSKVAEQDLRDQNMVKGERTSQMPEVTWWKVSGAEILEGPTKWAGKFIPVVPVLGEEVWVDGKMHLRSAIKWAKEPARLYNWARCNMAETMALAPKQPWLVTKDMIEGHEEQWDQANTKPQPYLTYNADDKAGAPQRQGATIQDVGAMSEASIASDDIKATTGIYDASMGATSNETSGVAIRAREAQGDNATFEFTDNMSMAISFCGRILVDLIPKIYDTERVVRLLEKNGAEGWVKINAEDPMQPGVKLNDITVGKYDVVVTTGPAYSTQRLEAADSMSSLLQSAPAYAPIIMPRLAKNLDWPEADEISEEMAAMNPNNQQNQGPSPEQQAAMQEQKMKNDGLMLTNKGKGLDVQKKALELEQEKVGTEEHVAAVTLKTLKQLGIIPDER